MYLCNDFFSKKVKYFCVQIFNIGTENYANVCFNINH